MSWSTGSRALTRSFASCPRKPSGECCPRARCWHSKDAPPSSENDPRGTLTPVPDRARSSSRRYARSLQNHASEGDAMKKFLNVVEDFLGESLAGLAAAHGDLVVLHTDPLFIRRRNLRPGKVALISGGGSGHEPLHTGFIGHGMLDAACPGQVFTSPTPDQMIAAAEAVDTGAGCLFIVKNYEGDIMNFDMAREVASRKIETVLTDDDVAVENSLYTTGRRGVAGTLIVEKVVGAAAETGADLKSLKVLGDRVNKGTRSMGVALTSCTVPAAGKPTFAIGED